MTLDTNTPDVKPSSSKLELNIKLFFVPDPSLLASLPFSPLPFTSLPFLLFPLLLLLPFLADGRLLPPISHSSFGKYWVLSLIRVITSVFIRVFTRGNHFKYSGIWGVIFYQSKYPSKYSGKYPRLLLSNTSFQAPVPFRSLTIPRIPLNQSHLKDDVS